MRPEAILFLAVLSLAASACTAGREAAPGKAAPAAAAPAGVGLTMAEMEEIRDAAVQYYEEKKPEKWQVYVLELRHSAILMKEDLPGSRWPQIGIWRIEQDDGIALVRWSADSTALFPGLNLAKEEGRWIVTGELVREGS